MFTLNIKKKAKQNTAIYTVSVCENLTDSSSERQIKQATLLDPKTLTKCCNDDAGRIGLNNQFIKAKLQEGTRAYARS